MMLFGGRRQFLHRSAVLLSGANLLRPRLAWAEIDASAGTVLRRLRFTYTFSNPLQQELPAQTFWCYLPAELGAQQRLREVQVRPAHRVLQDGLGHRILEMQFANVAPLAQKVVSLTTEIELNPLAKQAALVDSAAWLAPERFIEVEHAEIRLQAQRLRRDSPSATARAIYEWVQDYMQYAGYIADDLGALHALRTRQGDCTEYADLVVALARANGIPARMAGGYVNAADSAPRFDDYHNWAELYLDGGWRVVDAQKGHWWPTKPLYVLFRIYRDQASNPLGHAHRYRLDGQLQLSR